MIPPENQTPHELAAVLNFIPASYLKKPWAPLEWKQRSKLMRQQLLIPYSNSDTQNLSNHSRLHAILVFYSWSKSVLISYSNSDTKSNQPSLTIVNFFSLHSSVKWFSHTDSNPHTRGSREEPALAIWISSYQSNCHWTTYVFFSHLQFCSSSTSYPPES